MRCSVPVGAVTGLIFFLALPKDSRHHIASKDAQPEAKLLMQSIAKRIDFLGAFLILGGSVFLVAALENAGLRYPWKSGLVAGMLVVSGVLLVLFLLLERKITRYNGVREPVLPWRFLQSRISLGLFLYVPPFPLLLLMIEIY